MSGALLALIGGTSGGGSGGGNLTVASDSQSLGGGYATVYVDGYWLIGSPAGQLLSAAGGAYGGGAFGAASVLAIFWESFSSHAVGGSISICFSGNRAAGFLSLASCNGRAMGTIGAPSFDAGNNWTSFPIGPSLTSSNPFGVTGAVAIILG